MSRRLRKDITEWTVITLVVVGFTWYGLSLATAPPSAPPVGGPGVTSAPVTHEEAP